MEQNLDPILLNRIYLVKDENQILEMNSRVLKQITNNHDELYLRLLIERCDPDTKKRRKVFEHIRVEYARDNNLWCETGYGNYEINDRLIPDYFNDIETDIEVGLPLIGSDVSSMLDLIDRSTLIASSIVDIVCSKGELLSAEVNNLKNSLCDSVEVLSKINNAAVSELNSKISDLQNKVNALSAENAKLKQSEENWASLRASVMAEMDYDQATIVDAGCMSDRDLFIEIANGLIGDLQSEKEAEAKIQKLEEELKQWRENSVNKEEIEAKLKESIPLTKLKEGFINFAKSSSKSDLWSIMSKISMIIDHPSWNVSHNDIMSAALAAVPEVPNVKVFRDNSKNIDYSKILNVGIDRENNTLPS